MRRYGIGNGADGCCDHMAFAAGSLETCIPFPSDPAPCSNYADNDFILFSVPIHIVTHESRLPTEFLHPSPKSQLVIGFDCEGVDLCRHGTLCMMQLAYSLIEEQHGQKRSSCENISFMRLIADRRY
ncbi:uncharacterized protein [Coffea arabica]|uniref:Uncharacterized protein n=1 Tax=Coffea arabica TaxID=13443 RepID=A0ABM4U288_COFAR|nr:uncharacterized protein LOC113742679 isoform X3 [Coffea arabica]